MLQSLLLEKYDYHNKPYDYIIGFIHGCMMGIIPIQIYFILKNGYKEVTILKK